MTPARVLCGLGLGLMVAIFVSPIEGATYSPSGSIANGGNNDFKAYFCSAPRRSLKNIAIFDPAPNIKVFFASFNSLGINIRNTVGASYYLSRSNVRPFSYSMNGLISEIKIVGDIIDKCFLESGSDTASRRSCPTIFPIKYKIKSSFVFNRLQYRRTLSDICSQLALCGFASDFDGVLRSFRACASFVDSLSRVKDSPTQQKNGDDGYYNLPPSRFDEFLRRHRHSLLGGEVTAGNIIRLALGIAVGLGGGFLLIGLGVERLTRPGGAFRGRLFVLPYGGAGFVLLYSGMGFAFSSSLDGWSALYRGLLLPF